MTEHATTRLEAIPDRTLDALIGQLQTERRRRRAGQRAQTGMPAIYRVDEDVQVITCLACRCEFRRPRQRGQVPRRCPSFVDTNAPIRTPAIAPPRERATPPRTVNIGELHSASSLEPADPVSHAFRETLAKANLLGAGSKAR